MTHRGVPLILSRALQRRASQARIGGARAPHVAALARALSGRPSVAEQQRIKLEAASVDFAGALGVGGFSGELEAILRRVFMSRIVDPATRDKLGLRHARGLLLHGPPGTGKTLIARGLAKVLSDRAPKLVEGPEVFNHLLGASEQAVRGIFKAADDEWRNTREDSSLHVIIFDEIDSVLRKRGSGSGDGAFGSAARDGVVNQLLAKLDGLREQSNVLVIGTTNRLDLLDPAALRPGRLDVHVEVALPDPAGRLEILKLHARALQDSDSFAPGLDLDAALLAVAERHTQNFSGSELAAAVRGASSFALARAMNASSEAPTLAITAADLRDGADEVTPLHGRGGSEKRHKRDLLEWRPSADEDSPWGAAMRSCAASASRVAAEATPQARRRQTLALVGPRGAGKRTLAELVLDETPTFAFQRAVDASLFLGKELPQARQALVELFTQARRAPCSAIVLHDLELMQPELRPTLFALLREGHRTPHRLLTLATINDTAHDAEDLADLARLFDERITVPPFS